MIYSINRGDDVKHSVPKKCPVCGDEIQIQVLKCTSCDTEIQGNYTLDLFSKLPNTQLQFLETFIRCRGNLKDVGAILDISYPTARNRLDALIQALDFIRYDSYKERRISVLTALKEHSITLEEALTQLEDLQGGALYE